MQIKPYKTKDMIKEYSISIYLDTRRSKQNGKFPVKLRVFTPVPRIQKLYPLPWDFSLSEFQSIWETIKPRTEHKEIRLKMQKAESTANEIAKSLPVFNFETFEKKFFNVSQIDKDNVFALYDTIIEDLRKNNQIGTAENYHLSKTSLITFISHSQGKKIETIKKLSFFEITPNWLMNYETYMLHKGRSRTTISMYLRALRTVFNTAIREKEVTQEIYPFGKNKYQVPAAKTVKKALGKEQLKALFEGVPMTQEQDKAKSFWFFSYACNGINFKDIVNLKFKNLNNNQLHFYRAKTINTNKADLKPVIVYLNEFTMGVIHKYGNPNPSPDNYIFPFIDRTKTPTEQHRQLKNLIHSMNKFFDRYAKSLGFTEKLTTYWARHTFATTAIRNGASMEFVSEALSHSNLNTTRNYFAGFEDEAKKEFSQKLMDF
jgi:integrase/recombinase XerD